MTLANLTGSRSTVVEDVGNVAAASVEVRTLTVPDAEIGDSAVVNAELDLDTLAICQALVRTAGEVDVFIVNPTAGILDGGADINFQVQLFKATGSI